MTRVLSTCITDEKARNLFHAFEYAHDRGHPLTMHTTVIWAYLPDYPCVRSLAEQCDFARWRTSLVTKRLKDFHPYHMTPHYFAYVLENCQHQVRNFNKGVHTHLATHTPKHLRDKFMKIVRKAVFEGVEESARKDNTVVFRPHPAPWTVAHYLLKGSDTKTVLYDEPRTLLRDVLRERAPDVAQDPSDWDQGPIIGHRVGMSRSLDRTSRAAWASTQRQDMEYRLAA